MSSRQVYPESPKAKGIRAFHTHTHLCGQPGHRWTSETTASLTNLMPIAWSCKVQRVVQHISVMKSENEVQ